jgi:hypothetical protein
LIRFSATAESTLSEKVAPLNSSSVNQPNVNATKAPDVPSTVSPLITITRVAATLAPEIRVAASNRSVNSTIDASDYNKGYEFAEIDIVDEQNNQTLTQNNITSIDEDFHEYYNSTVIQDINYTKLHRESIYAECANLTVNKLLSKSHRRAMTIKLPFDFPFYGQLTRPDSYWNIE